MDTFNIKTLSGIYRDLRNCPAPAFAICKQLPGPGDAVSRRGPVNLQLIYSPVACGRRGRRQVMPSLGKSESRPGRHAVGGSANEPLVLAANRETCLLELSAPDNRLWNRSVCSARWAWKDSSADNKPWGPDGLQRAESAVGFRQQAGGSRARLHLH